MEKQYPIMWKGKNVGTATLERQGMFWRIDCKCAVTIRKPLKIVMNADGGITDLGICVSDSGGCGLCTRIPAKVLSEAAVFRIEAVRDQMFIPVTADAPFPAIGRLQTGKFAVINGQPGIMLND